MRSETDAALGSIVLEGVQEDLPQYASVRELKTGETKVTLGRQIKERRARRKRSGPGYQQGYQPGNERRAQPVRWSIPSIPGHTRAGR